MCWKRKITVRNLHSWRHGWIAVFSSWCRGESWCGRGRECGIRPMESAKTTEESQHQPNRSWDSSVVCLHLETWLPFTPPSSSSMTGHGATITSQRGESKSHGAEVLVARSNFNTHEDFQCTVNSYCSAPSSPTPSSSVAQNPAARLQGSTFSLVGKSKMYCISSSHPHCLN